MTIAEATAARDEGMQTAENAADPRLILAIDKVIAELNASGMPWSANDAREAMPTVSSGLVGARVHAAALRKPAEMVRVGMTRSTKRAWIAVWQGVGS